MFSLNCLLKACQDSGTLNTENSYFLYKKEVNQIILSVLEN